MQLSIEKQSLQKEQDLASKERLVKLEEELQAEIKERDQLKAQWLSEKNKIDQSRLLKEKLEKAHSQEEMYTREGNLEKAAELRYSIIPSLTKELNEIADKENSKKDLDNRSEDSLLRQEVTEEDIANVVSSWTGIPVSKMMSSEKKKFLELENVLHKRVMGQNEAVQVVSDAIRRNRSGLSDPNKPLGSFLFIGPTGVGKTELAKTLADFLFNDEKALTRIDMTEYMEKFSVTRLIGAPPGYVGYDEGGQLTEAVRRRPYSVVLFDEIEKAHPDVFNILLQVLDDGRLTDGQGRVVDFKNTIIIMTSNLGSDMILQADTKEKLEELKGPVNDMLKLKFRPEFLNRIDETVMFSRLDKDCIEQIVKAQVARVQGRLDNKHITLCVEQSAIDFLVENGYEPEFGARPVKRAIQTYLENPLAKLMLSDVIKDNSRLKVYAENGLNVLSFKSE